MKSQNTPWLMLASLYITQYIGIAFILSAATAILRQQGVALDELALLNLAVLPMAGKVIYAPIIDRYTLSIQGQYRGWLLIAQTGMMLLLIISGLIDFKQQFNLLLLTFSVYVLLMSIQDVAVDGLSCKLFNIKTRQLANSIQFSGNLMGNVIGGGIILMLYPWLNWQGSLWLLASLTCVSIYQLMRFNEPHQLMKDNSNSDLEPSSLKSELIQFITHHKPWFILLLLYPIGSTVGFALLNPLLVDSGWALDEIGFVSKIYGSIIGLFSAAIAAPLMTWIGREKSLISLIIAQAFALMMMIPLALGHTQQWLVYSAVTAHFCCFPALLVVTSTLMMDKAAKTSYKATFFTLQFSFASVFGFAYSALSMTLATQVGYSLVVIIGSGLTLAISLLIHFILLKNKKPNHTVSLNPIKDNI